MIRLTKAEVRGLRRSKYGATPVVIDNIRFASQAEGRRYRELCLLQKAGEIHCLACHPRFSLIVNGEDIGAYEADFVYLQAKAPFLRVVEDVKGGVATPLFRWKKKHLQAQYGITVTEIRYR